MQHGRATVALLIFSLCVSWVWLALAPYNALVPFTGIVLFVCWALAIRWRVVAGILIGVVRAVTVPPPAGLNIGWLVFWSVVGFGLGLAWDYLRGPEPKFADVGRAPVRGRKKIA